jgi:hypothetical protein
MRSGGTSGTLNSISSLLSETYVASEQELAPRDGRNSYSFSNIFSQRFSQRVSTRNNRIDSAGVVASGKKGATNVVQNELRNTTSCDKNDNVDNVNVVDV